MKREDEALAYRRIKVLALVAVLLVLCLLLLPGCAGLRSDTA